MISIPRFCWRPAAQPSSPAMSSRFVCVTTSWRKGKVSSCAVETQDPMLLSACVHELPPSSAPLSKETRRRVIQEHDRCLALNQVRCRQDCSLLLKKRLRSQPRPVFVKAEPPILAGICLGCVQTLTSQDVYNCLRETLPGLWEVSVVSGTPLRDCSRRLCDMIDACGSKKAITLLACLPTNNERKQKLLKRLEACEKQADAGSGATEAERDHARRAAVRTRMKLSK